jgi:hypothetical protein
MSTHIPTQRTNSIADDTDLENQHPVGQDISEDNANAAEENKENDPNIVTWDGEDDIGNPRNWSFKKKWTNGGLLAAMTLVTYDPLPYLTRLHAYPQQTARIFHVRASR